MKNIYTLILVCNLIGSLSLAQVGIGTDNPSVGASIEMVSTDKGLLIPRVSLLNNTDQTTVASPAKGLIVFNLVDNGTGTDQVLKNNFYYWNGVNWDLIVNADLLNSKINNLNIPQLAGYMYKGNAQQFSNPTAADNILEFANAANVSQFNTEYLELNPSDATKSTFKINKTGRYGIETFVCLLVGVNVDDYFHLESVLQKSTDNGVTWEDTPIVGTTYYSRAIAFGLTIPINANGALMLNNNDLLRVATRIILQGPTQYSDFNYYTAARSDALGVKYSAGLKLVHYP